MSSNTEDVRTKITPEELQFLNAVALACKDDTASIVRRLIREFLAAKRHEYTVINRVSPCEGTVRARTGNGEGTDQ